MYNNTFVYFIYDIMLIIINDNNDLDCLNYLKPDDLPLIIYIYI